MDGIDYSEVLNLDALDATMFLKAEVFTLVMPLQLPT